MERIDLSKSEEVKLEELLDRFSQARVEQDLEMYRRVFQEAKDQGLMRELLKRLWEMMENLS